MYLAIDIGGTKTLVALFSKHGRCLSRTKFLTNQNPDNFLSDLCHYIEPFRHKNITQIVIAVPGIVNNDYSVSPQNLPSWHNINIQETIKNLFTCPIHVLNDADLATIYETQKYSDIAIYLTFSTGIGGGIAKNGKILPESATFEPGHYIYELPNGTKSEWEDLAAASAINRKFDCQVTDLKTKNSIETVAYYMSLGLNSIVAQYHPSVIIIGGPISKIFKQLKPRLLSYLEPSPITPLPHLMPAKKPFESVIYGCYLYAKSQK